MKSFFHVLVSLIGIVWEVNSQVHPFLTYTIKNDLVSNEVRTLFQDSHGFLWIGTSEGLSRYDGVSFKNYTPAEGLPHNYVNHIIEDRNEPGALWVATNGGGVFKFSRGKFKTFSHKSDYYANYVGYLMQDTYGKIWCGTLSGIYLIENDTLSAFENKIKIHLGGIYETAANEIIFFSGLRLFTYSPKNKSLKSFEISKDSNVFYSDSFIDSKQNIWIVLSNGTLLKVFDYKIITKIETTIRNITFISEDQSENLWIGTIEGLFKIPSGSSKDDIPIRYHTEQGLPSANLTCGLIDREDNLWLGTYNQGMIKFSDQYVYKFPMPALSTPINNSQAVNDSAGHIWVATISGLWELWSDKKGRWSSYLHKVIPNNFPQTLLFDKQGKLWVGYAHSTIIIYEIIYQPGKHSKLEVTSSIPLKLVPEKSDVLCMMIDKQNRLICSISNYGILIIEFDTSITKPRYKLIADNLPDVSIRAIYEDRVGNIWLGGYWGGLGVVENGDWKTGRILTLKESDGLPNNAVRAICEDESGNLLVGTRYSGIGVIPKDRISLIFDKKEKSDIFCRTITMRDGLASNAIWCLSKEDETIFIGTNHGFQSMVYDQVVKFRNFRESFGERVALCGVTKNGVSWYLTRDVIVIDEDIRYRINLLPPKVLINSFTVDGVSIPIDSIYNFSMDNEQFVIEYVGVSLRDGDLIEYQYRLKDVVQNWSSWTRDRRVTFAGLKPGTHTFEVQAINADGFICEQPAQITFIIVTPLWQRWWFVFSFFLVLSLVFTIIIRYLSTRKIKAKLEKIKQEQAFQDERTRTRESISRDLHDEIASTLSGIGYFVQTVEKESGNVIPQNSRKYLSLIKESTDEILESIRDIIWSLNPENNTWEVVLTKCRRYTSDLCESKSISYKIEFPQKIPKNTPPLENLKNFWLIYKEIITNAIRHSECTHLDINISLSENSSYLIRISDNGKGFEPDKIQNGNGVNNIHSRIKAMNGEVELTTSHKNGTSWEITYPV